MSEYEEIFKAWKFKEHYFILGHTNNNTAGIFIDYINENTKVKCCPFLEKGWRDTTCCNLKFPDEILTELYLLGCFNEQQSNNI